MLPGKTYYYQIMATNSASPGASEFSELASATTQAAPPGKVTGVEAMADGQTAIELSWDEAESNGSDIVEYEVQRWDKANGQWVPAATVPAMRTTARVSGLTEDTSYAFRVRAKNRAPGNNGLGSWSTITFERTEAAPE